MMKKILSMILLLSMLLPVVCVTAPKAEAAYTAQQWKVLGNKFYTFLCGSTNNDMTNSSVKQIVTKIDSNCKTYWDKLKTVRSSGSTAGLFDNKIDNAEEMGWQYTYLWYMAQGYGTYGSAYYGNAQLLADILYGMDVMEKRFYTTSALKTAQANTATFNWWDWAYNGPMHLCRTLLAIWPNLTDASVNAYGYSSAKAFVYAQVNRAQTIIDTVKPITGVSNETVLTENRRVRLLSWIMLATLRGIYATSSSELSTAESMMTASHTALKDFFRNASAGKEGVNPDGSYICHTYFAMEGTYGIEVVVDRLIPAYTVLAGTAFEPTSADCQILAQWMLTTFRDVTKNGVFLSMNIGRYGEAGVSKGVSLLKGLLQLIGCFSPVQELELCRMVREMVPQSRFSNYAAGIGDVNLVATLHRIVYDNSIPVQKDERAVMRYTTDRAVQHREKYTVGLAMSSTRISTHDSTHGRNRYGWYTGDGMLYVYPDHTGYGFDPYGSNYHKYANMYRMPGTTEENSTRRIPNSCRNHYLPRTDFVGGVELEDLYIAAAMDFDGYTWSSSDSATYDNFTPGTNGQTQKRQVLSSDLEGNKSYFMFDDEIVCVGSGINFTTNSNAVYTYVNNLELRETASVNGTSVVGTEDVVVDGTLLDKTASYTKSYTNPKWIYQEAFGGYYFPTNSKVTVNKTARTTVNDYNLDINGKSTVTADGKTHSFLELWVDHGSKPSNGTYSYVMLPEKTQAETKAYAASPDITVASSSNTVHVVKEKNLGITGYVFWKAGTYGDITVNQPMILMVQEKDGKYSIAVSDPTHKLSSGTVTIKRALHQISADSKISVKNGSTTTLTVNFSGSYGKSFGAKFVTDQTPYLYFDFQNTEPDKARYNNSLYGGINFDTGSWRINTNNAISYTLDNSGIGTAIVKLKEGGTHPYLHMTDSTNSFNAIPLKYIPTEAEVAVLRFKLQNCALISGATTPQVRLYYGKNNVTTGIANSDYISAGFAASAVNSDRYITVTIPANAAFRGASVINSIRPVFFNVTNAAGKQGVITIDSIYVGPAQSKALTFDFRNDGEALKTYGNESYSGNNYDTGFWGYNSNRVAGLTYDPREEGSLTMILQEGGTDPYVQTTDRTKSLTSLALNYTPGEATHAVVRFRMNRCVRTAGASSPALRITFGTNNTGTDLASADYLVIPIPADALQSNRFITLSAEIPAAVRNAENVFAVRVSFMNVTHKADSVGEIELDYVHIGPQSMCPGPLYTVTFRNGDGTTLYTCQVAEGDTAVYNGATPTKAYDTDSHYSFRGWDKELTAITADTTVTAQYTATAHSYTYTYADANDHKAICTCGYSRTDRHSWNGGSVTTAPTCTAQGVKTYTCNICKGTKTESVSALGHNYTGYKATTNPTTSATGVLTGVCSRCAGTAAVTLPKLNTTDYTKSTTKAPTCTEKGTDSYKWNTTTYGTFTFTTTTNALGHSYTGKVTAPTCTAQGYTTYSCSRCSHSYKDAYVAASGHTEVIDKAVAATCTTSGKTEGKHCSICNTVIVKQETVAAPGHRYTYTEIDHTSHIVTCENCTLFQMADHGYVEGACICGAKEVTKPVALPTLKLGHTLNLASDISVNFVILKQNLEGFDPGSVYVECVLDTYEGNVKTGTRTVRLEPVDKGIHYYFTLTGLTAVQMNDSIATTLYGVKDGQTYTSPVDTYSIATYAYSQMNNPDRAQSLKILCADLLRYGSAAQIFKSYRLDALADSAMTEEHKAYLSELEAVTFGNTNVVLNDLPNAPITWAGKSLNLESKVALKFVFHPADYAGDLSALTLRISYIDAHGNTKTATASDPVLYNAQLGYYVFTVDSLLAAELRAVVSVRIYAGNTPVSATLQYSPDTYGNGKTGTLLDLCKALFAYSDSAKAYFAS